MISFVSCTSISSGAIWTFGIYSVVEVEFVTDSFVLIGSLLDGTIAATGSSFSVSCSSVFICFSTLGSGGVSYFIVASSLLV
jgi:hypothetical protein